MACFNQRAHTAFSVLIVLSGTPLVHATNQIPPEACHIFDSDTVNFNAMYVEAYTSALDAQSAEDFSIRSYQLAPPERYRLAMALAQKRGTLIAHWVQDFDLDEEQRFQVALLSAQSNPLLTAKLIGNFQIEQQMRRAVVASVVASYRGFHEDEYALLYIGLFKLTQNQRFEIAKIAATRTPVKTARNLHVFRLTQKQNFEVAKIIAETKGGRGGRWRFHFLNEYEWLDSKMRFELALIAIQDPEFEPDIRNFALTHAQRLELAKVALGLPHKIQLRSFGLSEEGVAQLVSYEMAALIRNGPRE